MNLSKELQLKAKWVSELMKADGVKPEQVTPEMALAYMDAIGKKIQAIQNKYLTNPKARESLQLSVLGDLQNA